MSTTTQATERGTKVWKIDASHSHAEFGVRHMMIATVKGRFSDIDGTVVVEDGDPTTANIDVTIGVASIDTRVEQRDQHLRSPDFFDVERFPTLTFRGTKVRRSGEDRYEVLGDLTIRDVTRPVTLDVRSLGSVRDPWGNDRAGYSATTRINRKDFGLNWNQVLETGGFVVGDEVKVDLEVELVRSAD
ncbi:MAG: YceI family protein [Gemmatimonadales bacterium]